jgi:hypothetical protein
MVLEEATADMTPAVPRHRPAQRLALLGGVLVACTFVATRPRSNGPYFEAAPLTARAQARGLTPRAASPKDHGRCSMQQDKRVFVGFSDDMTLDDFESAAAQAERLLAVARRQLCALPQAASEPALHAALAAHAAVNITELTFESRELRGARVKLERTAPADAAAQPRAAARWVARFERDRETWRAGAVFALR